MYFSHFHFTFFRWTFFPFCYPFFTHFDFSEIIVAICISVVTICMLYTFFPVIMRTVCTWVFIVLFFVFLYAHYCVCLALVAESWDWWNWKDIRVNENNIKIVNVSCVYVKWIIKFEICYIIRNHDFPGRYSHVRVRYTCGNVCITCAWLKCDFPIDWKWQHSVGDIFFLNGIGDGDGDDVLWFQLRLRRAEWEVELPLLLLMRSSY